MTQTFKGKLEPKVFKRLTQLKIKNIQYEVDTFKYNVPKNYTPDFKYTYRNKVKYLEVKGYLRYEDKKKLELIKTQYPDLDLKLVFQKDNKITKRHKMRYSDWAKKWGFKYWVLEDMGDITKEFLYE